MQGNIISQMNQAKEVTAVSVQEQLLFESNLHAWLVILQFVP